MRELALHLLDLAQNSVEAAATRLLLEITEDRTVDRLVIKVADNGRGMERETQKRALDPFFTSRKTRRVGLGLSLVAMSAAQCGGYLKVRSRPGRGTVVKACWRYSHLDRPPLGNVIATMMILFLANPGLDIVYRHKVADKRIILTSKEIAAVWPALPSAGPAAIGWLREYLTNRFCQLEI